MQILIILGFLFKTFNSTFFYSVGHIQTVSSYFTQTQSLTPK